MVNVSQKSNKQICSTVIKDFLVQKIQYIKREKFWWKLLVTIEYDGKELAKISNILVLSFTTTNKDYYFLYMCVSVFYNWYKHSMDTNITHQNGNKGGRYCLNQGHYPNELLYNGRNLLWGNPCHIITSSTLPKGGLLKSYAAWAMSAISSYIKIPKDNCKMSHVYTDQSIYLEDVISLNISTLSNLVSSLILPKVLT